MTQSSVVYTSIQDSFEAGNFIGSKIREEFRNQQPDVLLVFASARFDFTKLLSALQESCKPKLMMGCSSAGELTNEKHGEGAVSAVALRSDDLKFSVSLGRHLRNNQDHAADTLIQGFQGSHFPNYPFRAALVLTDALAGRVDELIESITTKTGGKYQLFGGGAGDDVNYLKTHVFFGTEVVADAVVALEILSKRPIGVGVHHGWEPASEGMRVTSSEGGRLISLNSVPSIEVLKQHALRTGQILDLKNPRPFLLHNMFGIDSCDGHKLRVPMGILEDGSVACAAEIPVGSTVRIMSTTSTSSSEASVTAVNRAMSQLDSNSPSIALFFDCVATRLRTGQEYDSELTALKNAIGKVKFAGFNTYGQIARMNGQLNGFHNSTAVVCILP